MMKNKYKKIYKFKFQPACKSMENNVFLSKVTHCNQNTYGKNFFHL